jgi:hypothetical protein
MSGHNSSLVNLSIPQEVTQPIVAAKIQEAVLAALGGSEKIIQAVVHQICNTKVNAKDGHVSSYSSDNTISWMDYHVTQMLRRSIEDELRKQVVEVSAPIKDELIKQLQSKKGASMMASAILEGVAGTFKDSYSSKFEVKFENKNSRGW